MLDSIDWAKPWYRAVRTIAEQVVGCSDWRAALNDACRMRQLCNHRGVPMTFVRQELLPECTAYESFISTSGQVPTRDNLHDFFNALIWLSFPETKRCLNAIQAAHIETAGIGNTRGPVRDRATLFDESAALLVVTECDAGRALVSALQQQQWQSLFVEQRDAFSRHVDVWIVGHALLEKLTNPYKAITAHTWIVFARDDYDAMSSVDRRGWLDLTIAKRLVERVADHVNDAGFTPLPLSGIPGWWPQQDVAFYRDAKVFRPRRHAVGITTATKITTD